MQDVKLTQLEQQVEHLLQTLKKLQAENQFLRQQFASFAREKSLWYQNNQQLVSKIKKIINQLQETL